MTENAEITKRTLSLIGGKEATPEQLALNVARWRKQNEERKALFNEAAAQGISVRDLRASRKHEEKERTKALKHARLLKASLHATLEAISGGVK